MCCCYCCCFHFIINGFSLAALVVEMGVLTKSIQRFAKMRKTMDVQEQELWERQEKERSAIFEVDSEM
jgi:hypothetical protein